MYEPSQGLGAKRIAAIAVLVLLAAGLGAGTTYYLASPRTAATATNTVTTTMVSTSRWLIHVSLQPLCDETSSRGSLIIRLVHLLLSSGCALQRSRRRRARRAT